MTDEERVQFKAKLEAEIASLRGRLPALKEEAKPVPPDNAVGRLSRMEAIREKGVRDAALREAKDKLQKLEARLEKVDHESFGLCASCRQPIPVARLMYLPETDRCVGCAR